MSQGGVEAMELVPTGSNGPLEVAGTGGVALETNSTKDDGGHFCGTERNLYLALERRLGSRLLCRTDRHSDSGFVGFRGDTRRASYRCEICGQYQLLCRGAEETISVNSGYQCADWISKREGNAHGNHGHRTCDERPNEDASPAHRMNASAINPVMEDADASEARFLDPWQVAVLGCPNARSLLFYFYRELKVQLSLCQLSVTGLLRRIPNMAKSSARHEECYNTWVREQVEEHRTRLSPHGGPAVARLSYVREKVVLLELVAYTVRFAVAVYSLPYELGYFRSMKTLALLQAEPYRRYVCATAVEQMEAMRRMLEGESPDSLLEYPVSRYFIQICRPCYAVVLDHRRCCVILSFRGSMSLPDAVVGVMAGYAEVCLNHPWRRAQMGEPDVEPSCLDGSTAYRQKSIGDACKVGGAEGCPPRETLKEDARVSQLRTRIPLGPHLAMQEVSEQLIGDLRRIHTQYRNYELLVTGHSLGGSEAVLFHLLHFFPGTEWAVPFKKIRTVAFSPAPQIEHRILSPVNEMLREEEGKSGSSLISIGYGKDCVNRLQVASVYDLLYTPRYDPVTNSTVAHPAKVQFGDSLPTLCVPGTLYNVPDSTTHLICEVAPDALWRNQLIFNAESMLHHFPCLYLRSIHRAHQHYLSLQRQMEAICK